MIINLVRIVVNIFVFNLLISIPLLAAINYELTEFESSKLSTNGSLLKINDTSFVKTSINPDFEFKNIKVGADLNIYIPLEESDFYPANLNTLTLRYIGYELKDRFGFNWGRLRNITYGYGLLMNNFDTGNWGTTEFNNKKAGAKGYIKLNNVRLDALWTPLNIKAGRVSYSWEESYFLGMDVVYGINYITDDDGVDEQFDDNYILRPVQSGLSLDIALPIGGDFFTIFAEYAELSGMKNDEGSKTLIDNGPQAFSSGFLGDLGLVTYKFQYRRLEKGFVPGYFNDTYQATSFNFNNDAPKEALNGFFGQLTSKLPGDKVRLGVEYEAYETRKPILSAALGWSEISNIAGVFNYIKPFEEDKDPMLTGKVMYKTNGLNYIINYQRIYINNNDFTETYTVGVQMNLDNILNL